MSDEGGIAFSGILIILALCLGWVGVSALITLRFEGAWVYLFYYGYSFFTLWALFETWANYRWLD